MGWNPKRNAVTRDRYRPHPQGVRGVCLYCGAAADTVDHVPPVAVAYMANEVSAKRDTHWLVPACGECNSTLSTFAGRSLAERRHFLAEKYRRRYQSIIRMPRWDDDELAEMGPVMGKDISNKQALKHHIWARLSRLKGSNAP